VRNPSDSRNRIARNGHEAFEGIMTIYIFSFVATCVHEYDVMDVNKGSVYKMCMVFEQIECVR